MKVAFIDLIPAFEPATKHKVTAVYGAPGSPSGTLSASHRLICGPDNSSSSPVRVSFGAVSPQGPRVRALVSDAEKGQPRPPLATGANVFAIGIYAARP